MDVWLVQIGELAQYLNNGKKMRTVLLAHELTSRGHRILWWTSCFDHFQKRWIKHKDTRYSLFVDELDVFLLKGIGYKTNFSLRRFLDHRILALKFRLFSPKLEKPDCIICSLPTHDLAFQVCRYSVRNKIPFIVDVRDPWPNEILNAFPEHYRSIARLLLSQDIRMVKYVMEHSQGIVAVSHNFMNWALSHANREKRRSDRVFYIGYEKVPSKSQCQLGKLADFDNQYNSKFIILFVGSITRRHHNPMILIKAAQKLADYKDILFVIAGNGEFYGEVKSAAKGLTNVVLTGWIDQDEITFLLNRAKVGTCPAIESSDLMTNKFFAYLSAGLPVISALGGELKEIIETYKVGFQYSPENVESFVEKIVMLYNDSVTYNEMSRNCYETYHDLFDANDIYKKYADYVEGSVAAGPS